MYKYYNKWDMDTIKATLEHSLFEGEDDVVMVLKDWEMFTADEHCAINSWGWHWQVNVKGIGATGIRFRFVGTGQGFWI